MLPGPASAPASNGMPPAGAFDAPLNFAAGACECDLELLPDRALDLGYREHGAVGDVSAQAW
jgi:hypothetical protein